MSTVSKNAILKALIDGAVTELMIKSTGENIYLSDGTSISSKIASMVTEISKKASKSEVTTQISALKTEILGNLPDDAYDTFTELAEYIKAHKEVSDALTSAIANKADKATVTALQTTINGLGALATKSKVAETDLDDTLKTKINNTSGSSHSHSNKTVLDGITSTKVTNWDNASSKAHSHSNKAELDKIATGDKEKWDGKGKIYVSTSQPTGLTVNDLWISI